MLGAYCGISLNLNLNHHFTIDMNALALFAICRLPSAISFAPRGCCSAFVASSSSCCSSSSSSSSCQFPLGSKATRQQEKNTILLTHCVYLRPVKKFLFVLTNLCLVFSCMACWCAWENSVSFCVCVFAWECVCVCVGVCWCVDDALKCYLQLVTYFMRLCFWEKKKQLKICFFSAFFLLGIFLSCSQISHWFLSLYTRILFTRFNY